MCHTADEECGYFDFVRSLLAIVRIINSICIRAACAAHTQRTHCSAERTIGIKGFAIKTHSTNTDRISPCTQEKWKKKKTTRNGRERRQNRRKEAEGEEEAVQNLHTPKSSFASYLIGSNKLLPARRHKTAEIRTATTITRRRRRRRRATATATATEYYSFTIKTHCALCHCVTD